MCIDVIIRMQALFHIDVAHLNIGPGLAPSHKGKNGNCRNNGHPKPDSNSHSQADFFVGIVG